MGCDECDIVDSNNLTFDAHCVLCSNVVNNIETDEEESHVELLQMVGVNLYFWDQGWLSG